MANLCGRLIPVAGFRTAMVVSAAALTGSAALANVPPATPTLTAPATQGQIVSPDDVQMEASAFVDTDVGDTHTCSDWEIWTLVGGAAAGALSERVWFGSCLSGFERRHAQLSDGAFVGTYAGRTTLFPTVNYRLRTRHRDSSPDTATQWSAFGERNFTTATPLAVLPFTLDDAAPSPTPSLLDAAGTLVLLPGGANPATLRIEAPAPAPAGLLVLEFRGQTVGGNLITNPGTIGSQQSIRIRATAGLVAWVQAASNLAFTDAAGTPRTIHVPAINLAPAATAIYWVALNGATFAGTTAQTAPDFTTLARAAPVPWTVRRPGFVVENFATGFQLPVNIAFIPSPGAAADAPLFYVAELFGAIKLVRRNGAVSTYASGLLNFNPTGAFPGSGELGLMGLCVQPGTGDLFATLLYDSAPPSGPRFPRVVRLQSTDGGLTSATQTTVLDMPGEPQGAARQISNVSIGPDGKLYVHAGDGADTAIAQINTSFRGKILRVNIDGSAPADNPFYSAVDGITATDYIYASGVRDPLGGAWRTSDGSHYIVERGPGVDRMTKLARGRNYLWDGTDAGLTNFALYNWNPAAAPANIAFVQSAVFAGSGFPATLYGRGYVAESGPKWATGRQPFGKRITEVIIDAAGVGSTTPLPIVEYNGSGKATCAAVAAGPDGVYFSDLYKDVGAASPSDTGANVFRIRSTGEAAFIASPESSTVAPPLNVTFTDASTVIGATAWLWSFGDGTTSTARNPVHVYTGAGCYTVRLTVTGPGGAATTQRPSAIFVSQPRPIAFIAGSTSLNTADTAVVDALRSMCYPVTVFDDNTNQRPAASQMAIDYGLAVVSSTVDGTNNIAGEFRTANIPMIFWEIALLTNAREALASAGTTQTTRTVITISNNTHPVTRGLSIGGVTMFNSNQTISLANGTVAAGTLSPNATVLGTGLFGTPGTPLPAILVAESGASLLSGYIAPAKRVFLFFNDTNYAASNTNAMTLLGNSVCWTMGLGPTITNQPANVTRPAGSTATLTVISAGHPGRSYRWRKAGVPLADGGRISGATTAQLNIANLQASDAGIFDVVVSTVSCGSVTSTAAMLALGAPCRADFNNSGTVTVQDVFDYLSAYFAGSPSADINGIGGVTVQDVFDYLAIYFVGCS